MRYYITPDDYETAEKNGIYADRLRQRVNVDGWTIDKAISEPIRSPQYIWKQWQEVAEKHGVKRNTFYQRVQRGMDPEQAATEGHLRASKIPQWVFDKAEANGISRPVLQNRINNGKWEYERACTEPTGQRGGPRPKKKRGWR